MSKVENFNRSIGVAEARQVRRTKLFVWTILIAGPVLVCFFIWRDISQGHYFRPVLFGSIGMLSAWRMQRNFKRASTH